MAAVLASLAIALCLALPFCPPSADAARVVTSQATAPALWLRSWLWASGSEVYRGREGAQSLGECRGCRDCAFQVQSCGRLPRQPVLQVRIELA